ncbi:membrane protein [Chania multitudinisentens RB-25]|uniref:Membrane protein n=1 Tax=Chania multitudinisentens RB-25 TaxID=1441930 RepID=W0LHN3_9GAMM|nr:hypothetical protein [Chania multitudinisentens]AHG21485.1 membrane protein [Chania multitudinisentens RB-25]
MDTVEELGGTYFYKGVANLSAGELFFWIFLDEIDQQLGIKDMTSIAMILLGLPTKSTRAKPIGATQGTSVLSKWSRRVLNINTGMRLATLTSGSIQRRKFSYTKNLGAFVGRWIPFVGATILASDMTIIAWKASNKYNTIAQGSDKLWS